MGIFPVAGPNARQRLLTPPLNSAAVGDVCHQPRVSFDPPAADRGCVFLRCRNHAVTMAHRAGGCHTPWAVFLPYRFNGSQCFFINLIDKSLSHGIPAGPWLANTTAISDVKRHGKRLRFLRAVILFVSFKILSYSILAGIWLKETLCGTNGYSNPFVHIQHTEELGSQLSKSHRRENYL